MKKEILCVLCSLFCFGYCFLIYSIKSGTRFYMIWGLGGCFFLGLTFFAVAAMCMLMVSELETSIAPHLPSRYQQRTL